jgi:hypothetical protein
MGKLFEQELTGILTGITKMIGDRYTELSRELDRVRACYPDSLEKRAKIAELKIQRNEIRRLQQRVSKALKTSTNRLVISTIEPSN